MAGPVIDKELQATLRKAFDRAGLMRHEYVTLEHVLLALTEEPNASQALPKQKTVPCCRCRGKV